MVDIIATENKNKGLSLKSRKPEEMVITKKHSIPELNSMVNGTSLI